MRCETLFSPVIIQVMKSRMWW